MPLNTASAAFHITPTVIKTFVKHYKQKASKLTTTRKDEITDDILFDEAFHIVKSFIELGTHNTVDSLQAFTNTHIVSPPWAAVSPVMIPLVTCNKAADLLVEWFDPDELQKVVGGEKWWQVRGLDGVEAEWVTERKFLRNDDIQQPKRKPEEKLSPASLDILKMDSLEKVMLYVHGGAYFWGSINTHRYQILKYARKIQGRVFAVNYRKAPQYPWPCPLQDVISAYLYLIDPPPQALHSPVPPSKIVVAGDSAGGGLCLALLTVLRDLGKPLPAGGVLISPWVDLTHSFPSVMTNTATDIIPPHGFIHKPSLIWPISPTPGEDGRIKQTESYPPPQPGHADTLQPDESRIDESQLEQTPPSGSELKQKEMMPKGRNSKGKETASSHDASPDSPNESDTSSRHWRDRLRGKVNRAEKGKDSRLDGRSSSSWLPKPPKVLMEDPNATPLELRSQIQLYATNEQLTHPLVSPVLQGSLGNLCPLYIIAGDGEVLRDEIVYMAHRASYPDEFPVPKFLTESNRQKENIEKFREPTKVHLQVFDGMCHVLTVFTFHRSAKYAYKSIAEFAKHVIEHPHHANETQSVFPEMKVESEARNGDSGSSDSAGAQGATEHFLQAANAFGNGVKELSTSVGSRAGISNESKSSQQLFEENKAAAKENIQEQAKLNRVELEDDADSDQDEEEIKEGSRVNMLPHVVMIRERVDIHGRVRQMEAKEEIPCLRLRPEEIGILKEAPARRWLTGQQEWDVSYKGTARKVARRRRKIEETYQKTIDRARELGLLHVNDAKPLHSVDSIASVDGEIQHHRRWGPLDLNDEKPPSSAIAGRRDTLESLALLRKTLYFTAPRTIKRLPKRQAKDVLKAAFSPADDPTGPPPQSISEQQNQAETPMHGLSIWASIMTYFTKQNSKKAAAAGKSKARHSLTKARMNFSRTASSHSRTSERRHKGL